MPAAGQLCNYLEKKVLDHVLKTASYSPPSTVYLALFDTSPGPSGGGTETTYTNYARQAITFGTAASKSIAQNALVTFPQCGSSGDTVDYFALFDAATGGNMLAYGQLNNSVQIVNGNTPTVASGQVTISISAGAMFTAFADTVLQWLFGGGSLSQPTNVQVALSTTTPTDAGGNITEPSGNGYSRETCNAWNAASGNPESAPNTNTITMPTPTGSWGTITYSVLYGDSTPMFYGTVPNQAVNTGDTVEWLAGQFTVSIQ